MNTDELYINLKNKCICLSSKYSFVCFIIPFNLSNSRTMRALTCTQTRSFFWVFKIALDSVANNYIYSRTSNVNCEVNNFRCLKQLIHLKYVYWEKCFERKRIQILLYKKYLQPFNIVLVVC